MRSSRLRLLLALFWFVWTGIVIPIHTRGIVPLIGTPVPSCCQQQSNSASSSSKHSAPVSSSNCAICQLAAHLMPAVYVSVDLKPRGFVEVASIPLVHCIDLPSPRLCFLGRAPPAFL